MGGGRLRFDIRRAGKVLLMIYVAVVVANGLFFGFLTRPKSLEHTALTAKTSPQRLALQRKTVAVEELEAYLAALDETTADLSHLRNEVLSTKERRMIPVQFELAKLCRRFNIKLEQVTYENELLESEGLERLGMVVPLEGGYQSLRSFIQAVENSDKFLVIERVALGQSAEGGVLLSLNITLATYFDASDELEARPRSKARPRRT